MKAASALAVTGSIAALAYFRLNMEDMKATGSEVEAAFSEYCAEFGKSYITTQEYQYRLELFEQNYYKIVEHNS